MSGPGGTGLPQWWGALGSPRGFGTQNTQNPTMATQMQDLGLGQYCYQQQQMNAQMDMQRQMQFVSAFAGGDVAVRKESPPYGMREAEDVPDWMPPTRAQIWGLVVFCAVYLMFVGAFYWGLP